jgi:hypothetical protein
MEKEALAVIHSIGGRPASRRYEPPPNPPVTVGWLLTALGMHAMYLAFAVYLMQHDHYKLHTALLTSSAAMLMGGVVVRIVLPPQGGPVVGGLGRGVRVLLQQWLQSNDTGPDEPQQGAGR